MKLIIEPGRGAANYWADVWRYRELLYFLTWRDIMVRYKQTAIGIAWALIRPGLTLAVFVAFRRLSGMQQGAVPDVVYVLAAVLPWQFFSTALVDTSNSVVGNSALISKVYFPRLLVPVAAVATAFADFMVTVLLLFAVMAWYGMPPGPTLLLMPMFVLLAGALSLGLGLLTAALTVTYRDFRYVVPFAVQLGLFISPVAFSTSQVPEHWRSIYAFNPMAGIIDGFRWSITGTPADIRIVAVAVALSIASLVAGTWYFRRTERGFADAI